MWKGEKVYEGQSLQKLKFGSSLYTDILNVLFVVYALLLPFSNAFSTHTGPYLLLLFWLLEGEFSYRKWKKIKLERSVWFLLIFFAINVLSMLWTDNSREGIYNLKILFCNHCSICNFLYINQRTLPSAYYFRFSYSHVY